MNDYLKNRYGDAYKGFDFTMVQNELLFNDTQLMLFKRYLRTLGYLKLNDAFDFTKFVEIVEVGLEF